MTDLRQAMGLAEPPEVGRQVALRQRCDGAIGEKGWELALAVFAGVSYAIGALVAVELAQRRPAPDAALVGQGDRQGIRVARAAAFDSDLDQRLRENRSALERAVATLLGSHQGDVDVAVSKLILKLDAGGRRDADFDLRMGCGEAGEDIGKETGAEIIGGADAHATLDRRRQKLRHRLFVDPEDLAGLAEQRFAIRGERH